MGSSDGEPNEVYMTNTTGVAMFRNGNFVSQSDTWVSLSTFYDKATRELYFGGVSPDGSTRGIYVNYSSPRFYSWKLGYPLSISRDPDGYIRVGSFRGQAVLKNDSLWVDTLVRPYQGVICMSLDSRRRLWKGTEDGVYVELPDGTEYRVMPHRLKGSFSSLLVYRDRYLVVGGLRSFFVVAIDEVADYNRLPLIETGYESGFTGLESGQNGIYADRTGEVWLATSLNVLKFNPDSVYKRHLSFLPPLRIASVSYSADNINWQRTLFNSRLPVEIVPGNLFYQFEYIANSISSPHLLQFKYRLKGLQDEWSEPVVHKVLSYTNLPYGEYRFEVMCSLDGINWSPVVSSPLIVLERPWYSSILMIVIYILVGLSLLIAVLIDGFRRVHSRRMEHVRREQLENELQLNTLRSKILPHFTKNVLSAIGHFAMTDKLRAGYYISLFSKFTEMTLANADKSYISIGEELEHIKRYLELEAMRFNNRFEFKIQLDPDVTTSTLIPTMILHTYCDNAVRHGLVNKQGRGLLQVVIKRHEVGVRILVEDDGIGRKRASELGTRGNGIGMELMKQHIQFYNQLNQNKIVLDVMDLYNEDGSARGTRIVVFIPDFYTFNQ